MTTFPGAIANPSAQLPAYSDVTKQNDHLNLKFSEKQHYEANAEVTRGDGAKVKVSASYSSETTVTLSGKKGGESSYASVSVSGAAQYSAISGEPAPERTQAASNILSFIGLQLERDVADGATQEELASRLQAGYEGFVQGYREAYEQLAASGLLTPEVEDAISQTYEQVLAGIDALAEELGVESPVSKQELSEPDSVEEAPVAEETGVITTQSGLQSPQDLFASLTEGVNSEAEDLVKMLDTSLLDYSKLDYETKAERDFSFQLRTQDGDFVKITAGASMSASGSYRDGSNVSGDYSESSRFSLKVEGELDEDELAAINDLLSQVGDLSEVFFAGDIEQAFNMALEIGFDENEIAQFSLNLQQSVQTKVQATYEDVAAPYVASSGEPYGLSNAQEDRLEDAKSSKMRLLSGFVDMLNNLAARAEELGFAREDIPRFAGYVAELNNGENDGRNRVERFFEKMLENLPNSTQVSETNTPEEVDV